MKHFQLSNLSIYNPIKQLDKQKSPKLNCVKLIIKNSVNYNSSNLKTCASRQNHHLFQKFHHFRVEKIKTLWLNQRSALVVGTRKLFIETVEAPNCAVRQCC